MCKCHLTYFGLILEQRKKDQFGCCNAADLKSRGGILNRAEAMVSLSFLFSLSASKPLHTSSRGRENGSGKARDSSGET